MIRPARLEDWPAMSELNIAAGRAAWEHILPAEFLDNRRPPDRWREAIVDGLHVVLVAEVDGAVAGFAHLRRSEDADARADTGELDSFYVHPDFWGRGVGRELLATAVQHLAEMGFREATLWTAELNHRPRRVYENAGWALDGEFRVRSLGGREFVELRYRIETIEG